MHYISVRELLTLLRSNNLANLGCWTHNAPVYQVLSTSHTNHWYTHIYIYIQTHTETDAWLYIYIYVCASISCSTPARVNSNMVLQDGFRVKSRGKTTKNRKNLKKRRKRRRDRVEKRKYDTLIINLYCNTLWFRVHACMYVHSKLCLKIIFKNMTWILCQWKF